MEQILQAGSHGFGSSRHFRIRSGVAPFMEKAVVQALVQARFTNICEVAEGKISFNLAVIVTAGNLEKAFAEVGLVVSE